MSSFEELSAQNSTELSEMTVAAFSIVQQRIVELIRESGWEEEEIEEFNEILNNLMNGYKDV